jgi:hypothetical protein
MHSWKRRGREQRVRRYRYILSPRDGAHRCLGDAVSKLTRRRRLQADALDKCGQHADNPVSWYRSVRIDRTECLCFSGIPWSHPSESNRRPADYEPYLLTDSIESP